MKKINFLAFALFLGFIANAQTGFEASNHYGRLHDLTYDATVQNKIYAATQGNHIVMSTDNGTTWNLLYSHPVNEVIQDLKFVPGNTALSFRTGDAIHILNLATNTITASFPIPQSGITGASPSWLISYDLYDASGNIMVVNTGFKIIIESVSVNFSKVFYTNNAGASWNEIYFTFEHDNVFINDVAISPDNPSKVFLARGNGNTSIDGGLWISENQGQDWTATLEGVTFEAITFNPVDANDIMIGSSIGDHPEKLYRSKDNGVTWNEIAISWTNETLNNIVKIVFNPANTDQIIVLEENEIIRTNDGGSTWDTIVYPVLTSNDYYYGTNASYNPFNGDQITVATDLYPQFFDTTTGSLTQIQAPFFNVTRATVGTYSGTDHLYYGGQGGRHHKDMSSGVLSVYNAVSPTILNPIINYMFPDPYTAGRVFTYASGFSGGWVTMSMDYGATTTNLMDAFSNDMQEVTVDPNNTNIIYVSLRLGESGNMFKIDVTDSNNVVSTEIFTPQVNEFGQGVVGGIVIDPANSNTLYISKGHKVFKSTDGGVSWMELGTGLEEITDQDLIWNLTNNPLNPNQLTIGTNIGIFTTMDSGANWFHILAGANVKRIKHSTLNDGVIAGSILSTLTDAASIVYTANNGVAWQTVTGGDLNYVQSFGMDYVFDGTDITAYIATTDIGVVKHVIHNVTLGTDHPVANNPVNMYPNPTSGNVTVYTDNNTEIKSVTLYNLSGQQVLQSKSSQFNVSGLSDGIYLVKAETNEGKSLLKKLVKE